MKLEIVRQDDKPLPHNKE